MSDRLPGWLSRKPRTALSSHIVLVEASLFSYPGLRRTLGAQERVGHGHIHDLIPRGALEIHH